MLSLSTGNPTDDTRAKLVVTGGDQACAIVSTCQGCDNVVVQNIQVAGQRDVLGYNNGVALLEMGGDNMGQTVKNCKLWEPRGWSASLPVSARVATSSMWSPSTLTRSDPTSTSLLSTSR